ncbi:MAG: hypothetical protein ABR497_06365 [Kiritimatiellia bacterium]|nr:hypothetical protein [Lentisphaerota bacterium]
MLSAIINKMSGRLRASLPCRRLIAAGPLIWFACILCAVEVAAAETEKPIEIGSRLELFVDRLLVDRMDGVAFRMHTPCRMPLARSPLNDVTPGQSPYGTGKDGQPQFVRNAYATVIKDGDLYRAYYRDVDPAHTGLRALMTCYAESADGHEWVKPELGIIEVGGSKANNVIVRKNDYSHNFSPFLDTNPAALPEERFKALAMGRTKPDNQRGLTAFVSADGIHWQVLAPRPVITLDPPEEAFDSQNVAFWSETEGLYVCYFRSWRTGHGKLRTISRITSPDFINWNEPVCMEPNLPGEHLYTSQTHPYFRAPHIYIALPTRYTAGQVDGGPSSGGMVGSSDILFMATRPGSTRYDRLFTEAFIRPGLDSERWGNRANYAALNVVPTGPAEMSIYHAVSGHRYTLRTDGFISIHAGSAPGEMVTKPLVFQGDSLVLNYSTAAAGHCLVELQTSNGQIIPGFGLDDCIPLIGDHLERAVVWENPADLSELSGQPVRLRFVMQEADLYSMRFHAAEDRRAVASRSASSGSE